MNSSRKSLPPPLKNDDMNSFIELIVHVMSSRYLRAIQCDNDKVVGENQTGNSNRWRRMYCKLA